MCYFCEGEMIFHLWMFHNMMLEILQTHLLHFFIVLIVLSYEQVLADNVSCEHSCRVNSTIMCLQFYDSKTDLYDARTMCRTYKSTLLSEREYSGNYTCFKTYLQGVGDSTSAVWLDPEYDTRHDMANVLNTTGTFSDNIEYGLHSMICITQGSPVSSHRINYKTSDTKSSVLNTRDHSPNNEKQALAGNATCEHSCRVNLTIVCLQFYDSKTDLYGANRMCMKYNSTLLSEREYNRNSTCFKTYLQAVGDSTSTVWLYPENPIRDDIVHVLKTAGTFSEISEEGRHSMICTTQGTSGSGDPTALDKDRSTISTKDYSDNKESTQPGTQNPKTSKDLHWDVSIPMALVTAATVLIIGCIACVVCGVILFRTREKNIKSIRKITTPVGSAETTHDSEELRSTVHAYANIKPKRPNSELRSTAHVYVNITPKRPNSERHVRGARFSPTATEFA